MTDSITLWKKKRKKLWGESGVSSWVWVVVFFFTVFFFFFFLGVDVDLFLFVQETVTCVFGQGLRFWNLFLKGTERAPCSIWWSRGWRVRLSWSRCGRFPWAAGFSWFSPSSWFGDLLFKVRPRIPPPPSSVFCCENLSICMRGCLHLQVRSVLLWDLRKLNSLVWVHLSLL